MTDKEKFLNEVKEVKLIIQANRAQGAFSEGYLIGQESVLEHFEKFIDSLQEEPVSTRDKLRALSDGKQHLGWLDDAREVEEEPVSEELNEAAFDYAESCKYEGGEKLLCVEHFKAGADWKEQQFEKNRLKHCNSITNEQAEMEQGFIDQHLDKYQRMPTFLDAIEYGMNLQKEQMINKATKWLEENLAKETSAIVCGSANIDFEHAIEEFKKAMED